jgi:2,5-diketo-D-gluconate reductase A
MPAVRRRTALAGLHGRGYVGPPILEQPDAEAVMTELAPTITLANGVAIPAIGLGTWPMDDGDAETAVATALATGYRLVDTAENYHNETGVGRGIKASGVDRAEIFLTSKFNVRWHGYAEVQEAFAASAKRLGVDYIDLFLIHWPNPGENRYVEAFRGMIKLLEDGKIRALGVSNFKPAHLDRLVAETGTAPHLNQIQLNPYIARKPERDYHRAHKIVTECWSPIGKGGALLDEPAVVAAATRHGRTASQVVLRWHVQNGLLPIPKSSNPERLALNLDVFGFTLSDAELAAIAGLDRGNAGAVDSDTRGH